MKLRVREKQEAIRLRKLGHTYSEIMKVIPVTKGTLSGWLIKLKLTNEEAEVLTQRTLVGREKASQKASVTNIQRRILRDQEIERRAEEKFKQFVSDPLFAFGIAMYWAEGSKKWRNFRFTNSDPRVISIMMDWIRKFLDPPEGEIMIRLYIHKPYAHENCESFWSQIVNIPVNKFKKTVYKSTPHDVKRNPVYKGCLSIDFGKVHYYVTVVKWINLLNERLCMVRP